MSARTSILATMVAAAAAAVIVASAADAGTSRPASHTQMQWFRWDRQARPHRQATRFGATAIVGLEAMGDLSALRARYGFGRVRAIPMLRAAVVSVTTKQLRSLLAKAPADARIRYVSPLGPRRTTLGMPSDPLVREIDPVTGQPFEWQFTAAGVDGALDHTAGDPRVVVGIIDSGLADVPDLAGKVDGLWSVAPDGAVTADALSSGNDDTGHGTAVASLIAANVDDGFGMAGFGGAAHIVAVHAGLNGSFRDTSLAIALMKLDSLGVRIVNMSLGAGAVSEPILIDAIHKAAADGILIVAAAGNEHGDVAWPAAELQPSGGKRSFGLAVGATDRNGTLAGFSNSGKHLSLVAPGTLGGPCPWGVLVALPPDSVNQGACYRLGEGGAVYGYAAGTSFAAPEVAGIAALVWAARPSLTNYQVADIIKQSARRSAGTNWTPGMGCGVLDAAAALELTTSRSAADWAAHGRAEVGACSVDGAAPPTWPSEARQQISFSRLPNRTIGEADFKLSAKASSGLPVAFVASGRCTIRRGLVHLTGLGLCTITASQAGNDEYHPARLVAQVFSVTKARSSRRAPARRMVGPRTARALETRLKCSETASLPAAAWTIGCSARSRFGRVVNRSRWEELDSGLSSPCCS